MNTTVHVTGLQLAFELMHDSSWVYNFNRAYSIHMIHPGSDDLCADVLIEMKHLSTIRSSKCTTHCPVCLSVGDHWIIAEIFVCFCPNNAGSTIHTLQLSSSMQLFLGGQIPFCTPLFFFSEEICGTLGPSSLVFLLCCIRGLQRLICTPLKAEKQRKKVAGRPARILLFCRSECECVCVSCFVILLSVRSSPLLIECLEIDSIK